jgi:hypothetical protein
VHAREQAERVPREEGSAGGFLRINLSMLSGVGIARPGEGRVAAARWMFNRDRAF